MSEPSETNLMQRMLATDRCALLSIMLLALLIANSFDDEGAHPELPVAVVYTLAIVVGVYAVSVKGVWLWLGAGLGALTLLHLWGGMLLSPGAALGALKVLGQAFLAYLSVRVIVTIWRQSETVSNRMWAAICGYLCIGILFSNVYALQQSWQPGAIVGVGTGVDGAITRSDLLYFSFVTQTTLGYGEMSPATPQSRAIAMLQAITGVLYVATTIASLVARRDATRA